MVLLFSLGIALKCVAGSSPEEQHVMVSMRMIGHQVLLQAGDTTSRVLPVEKLNGRYQIRFENPFSFTPEKLSATIDRWIGKTRIAGSYIVEVTECGGERVVYSYERSQRAAASLVPCQSRKQPKACYELFITITAPFNAMTAFYKAPSIPPGNRTNATVQQAETAEESFRYGLFAWPVGVLIPLISVVFVLYKRKKKQGRGEKEDLHILRIGSFRFDPRNMVLSGKDGKMELSSKESDLLALLIAHQNQTLERDQILKIVWGDEGDYVGRTLDVFISKLRKKLESDPDLKIANIRGIGYRFIVN